MIYTIGTLGGKKNRPVINASTLQAITTGLSIERILDWRESVSTDEPLSKRTLRDTFDERYSYVGNRCSANKITAGSLKGLKGLNGTNTLLLFEKEIPGECNRHKDLAVPLMREGVKLSHICGDEVIKAEDLQNAIEDAELRSGSGEYEFTTWRQEVPKKHLDPIKLPDSIQVQPAKIEEQSMLISISFGTLGNHRKVSSDSITVKGDEDVDMEMLRVTKLLLDSPELKSIDTHDGKVSAYLKSRCIPSMFKKGVWRVPDRLVLGVDERLNEFASERKPLVEEFLKAYPQRVKEACGKGKLGTLANEADYPPVERVASKFYFTWQYLEYRVNEKLKSISSAVFNREAAKLSRQVAASGELIQQAQRASLQKLFEHMIDRLTPGLDGKKKTFSHTMLDRMNEFLSLSEARNITGDVQLAALVQRAKDIVKGVDAEALRTDDALRSYVHAGVAQLQSAISSIIVNKPTRAYRIEE